MRVITGSARGRKLTAPPGLDTRPTTELVKEAVFSAVQFELEGANVLDLFAGSGQMGIEALSRGARHCVFVDSARQSQTVLRQNLASTGFEARSRLSASDVFSYLRTAQGPFDLVFLDPPYGQGMAAKALALAAGVMSPSGVIICETGKEEAMPPQAGDFGIYRQYRYGKTYITQYRHVPQEETQSE